MPEQTTEMEELRRRVAALEAELAAARQPGNDPDAQEARRSTAYLIELQHRVRNMLAVIRAVVRRSAASNDGRDAEEFAAHLSGRLDALARVHGLLTRGGDQAVDLAEVIRDEILSQGGIGDEQVLVEGPPVLLRGKAAETLGLVLHELATNAVKFGAWAAEEGRVEVRWHVDEEPDDAGSPRTVLHLTWVESGAGHDGAPPDRVGFGRDLIEHGLPYGLGARTALGFQPGGMRCAMVLPAAYGPQDEADAGGGSPLFVGEAPLP